MPYSAEILRTRRITWWIQFWGERKHASGEVCFEMQCVPASTMLWYLSHFPQSMVSFTSKLYLPYYSTSSEDFSAVWHFNRSLAIVEKINYVFYNDFVYEVIENSPKIKCKYDFLYELRATMVNQYIYHTE